MDYTLPPEFNKLFTRLDEINNAITSAQATLKESITTANRVLFITESTQKSIDNVVAQLKIIRALLDSGKASSNTSQDDLIHFREIYGQLGILTQQINTLATLVGKISSSRSSSGSTKSKSEKIKEDVKTGKKEHIRAGQSYTYTYTTESTEGRSSTFGEAAGFAKFMDDWMLANINNIVDNFDTVLRMRLNEYAYPERYAGAAERAMNQFMTFIKSRDMRAAIKSMAGAQQLVEAITHVSKEQRGMLYEQYDIARKQLGLLGNLVFTLQSDYLFKRFYQLSLRPMIDALKASPWFMMLESITKPVAEFLKKSVIGEAAMAQLGVIATVVAPFLKLFPVHVLLKPFTALAKATIGSIGYWLLGDQTGYEGNTTPAFHGIKRLLWPVSALVGLLRKLKKDKDDKNKHDKGGGGDDSSDTTTETTEDTTPPGNTGISQRMQQLIKGLANFGGRITSMFSRLTGGTKLKAQLAGIGTLITLFGALVGKDVLKTLQLNNELTEFVNTATMASVPLAFGMFGMLADLFAAAFTGIPKPNVLKHGKNLLNTIADAVEEKLFKPLRKLAREDDSEDDTKTEQATKKATDKAVKGLALGDKIRDALKPIAEMAEPLTALMATTGLALFALGKATSGFGNLVDSLGEGLSAIVATLGESVNRMLEGVGTGIGNIIARPLEGLGALIHGSVNNLDEMTAVYSNTATQFKKLESTLTSVNTAYAQLVNVLYDLNNTIVDDRSIDNDVQTIVAALNSLKDTIANSNIPKDTTDKNKEHVTPGEPKQRNVSYTF